VPQYRARNDGYAANPSMSTSKPFEPEIAHELYLPVNTVNTHVRNIFAKLDAGTRSAAVDRARELRLLSTSVIPNAGAPTPGQWRRE
jgi:hypothetical protein